MSAQLTVVAFVDDLMDRSRVSAAVPGVRFARAVDELVVDSEAAPIDVVVIDLVRYASKVELARALVPQARFIGFAPHVSEIARDETASGVDIALPRSRFFHDIRAVIGYS